MHNVQIAQCSIYVDVTVDIDQLQYSSVFEYWGV